MRTNDLNASFCRLTASLLMGSLFFLPTQLHGVEISDGDAIKQLDEAKSWEQWMAANERLKLATNSDRPRLESYWQDRKNDGSKRLMAFRAANRFYPESEAVLRLKEAFQKDKDQLFRADAAREMGKYRSGAFRGLLIGVVDDSNEDGVVKAAAIEGLATMGDAYGKTAALASIKKGAPWADMSMRALEILKSTDTVPDLEQQVKVSTSSEIRDQCRVAILRIKLATEPENVRLKLLSQALNEKDAMRTRHHAALQLAKIGTPNAAVILAQTAENKDAPGYRQAIDGLRVGMQKKRWSKTDVDVWRKKIK